MADSKLSALPAGAAIADADLFYSDQSATSVKQPATALATYLISKTGIGSAVTSGTPGSVLFVGAGPVLAQDNANLFWDDTNFYLKVGNASSTAAYYLNTKPALFEVPNASGNNWFEGNAGNFTVTGSGNFGTGDGALSHITSGSSNFAVGTNALQILTTASFNTAVGIQALNSVTSGDRNTAVGSFAGLIIGTGTDNFAFGFNALRALTTGSSNVAVGGNCLTSLTTFNSNVAIGQSAFVNLTGTQYNTGLGAQIGHNWSTGTANAIIGQAFSGFNVLNGDYNTLIGAWQGPTAAMSGVIAITDGHSVANVLANDTIKGVDYNYTTASVWSFQYLTTPIGLHVYNTTDGGGPPTNYERACLDWNLTSNVFRLASQAGGTGTVRLIAIDGFQKAGAPAAGDLPSGTCALINDTTNNQTWLVYNNAGTIRKVQLT